MHSTFSPGRWLLHVFLFAGVAAAGWAGTFVVIGTEVGEIKVRIEREKAPITAANFLRYVENGFYDGGFFHRAVTPTNQDHSPVKIEVVQGGINPTRKKESFPPIVLESTDQTGLRHLRGTISMARAAPDTARHEFFICLEDEPELDFDGTKGVPGKGFAAFGQVVAGMEVVRKIHQSPADGQRLEPPIRILSVRVEEAK